MLSLNGYTRKKKSAYRHRKMEHNSLLKNKKNLLNRNRRKLQPDKVCLQKTDRKRYTQQANIRSIHFKVRNKKWMSAIYTPVKHCTGKSHQCNKTRK